MQNFFAKIAVAFKDPVLRRRIGFTIGMLIVFRVLAAIPMPGVNPATLSQLLSSNQFFGFLNIFSGGGLSNLSIVMLGVGPYITASIIMQLLTVMSPALKRMHQEEGEAGRKRFAQYSRLLTVPLALVQGYAFIKLLQGQGALPALSVTTMAIDIAVITAGSLLLMWIGELISEFGIGNGVSLIIFAGIVSRLPSKLSQLAFTFDASQIPVLLLFFAAGLLIIAGVVIVTEAERPIPVTYAKRVRGMKMYGGGSTYLPLRVNQAGVIPIIFALSILLLPQILGNFLATASN